MECRIHSLDTLDLTDKNNSSWNVVLKWHGPGAPGAATLSWLTVSTEYTAKEKYFRMSLPFRTLQVLLLINSTAYKYMEEAVYSAFGVAWEWSSSKKGNEIRGPGPPDCLSILCMTLCLITIRTGRNLRSEWLSRSIILSFFMFFEVRLRKAA